MQVSRRESENGVVTLDRYAEISAYVRYFPADKQAEVVARLGVRPRFWQKVKAQWSTDIESSTEEGRVDVIKKYSDVFNKTRRRLVSLKPTLESLGPLPTEADEPPASEAVEPAVGLQVAGHQDEEDEPKVELPSFMSNPIPTGPAKPGYFSTTGLSASDASAPSAPFSASAPSAPPLFDASAPSAPPLFEASAPSVSPPFSASAPSAVPLRDPSSVVGPTTPINPRGRTLSIPLSSLPMAAQLPFKGAASPPEEAAERAKAHANAVQGPASRSVSLGETLDTRDISRPPVALPIQPIPEYTVERYSSLWVELREYPERRAGVLSRYNLDETTFSALEDDWKRRMNGDSAIRSKFLDACERYRTWLRSRDAAQKAKK